jgi:S1-C subfamily serine protease
MGKGPYAVCTSIALLALALPMHSQGALDKQKRRRTMQGVVFVLAADMDGGELKPIASGSGTILTPDGAVLTNHHVVYNEQKGQLHDVVAIGLLKSFDEDPELTCLARPSHGLMKPELDLALIKCEVDMQMKPFSPKNWPHVPAGSSEDLVPGDEVFVIGYPGVGGTTINVTQGTVSGFQSERGGAGRDWIKTDAAITHGNSGGTAVDQDGLFIGVPSAFRVDTEKTGATIGNVGLIRPIELARDLVNLAQTGFPAEGRTTGSGFGKPATPAPAAPSGVIVIGQVRASDNDLPVRGALVLVMKPGTKVRDINRDNVGEKFLTKAVTTDEGTFVMEGPVPRNQRYTVLVAADSYELLAADDILSTEGNVPDRYDPWGTIRLSRE